MFQRTPPWLPPKPDRPYVPMERFVFSHLPPVRRLYRSLIYWALEMRVAMLTKGSWLQHYHKRRALDYRRESMRSPANSTGRPLP